MGPVVTVPFMIISVYGMGWANSVPIYMKILMYTSYLRFGLEGLVISVYGNNREGMDCPKTEFYCHFKEPERLLQEVGMIGIVYWIDVVALIGMVIFYRGLSFLLLRRRLSTKPSSPALTYLGQFVKSRFSLVQNIK